MEWQSVLATTWVVVEYAIKIVALGTVPENRRPSSSTAWLLLIFLLPFVGLPLYIFLGSPWIHGKRRAQQTAINEFALESTKDVPYAPEDSRHSPHLDSVLRMNRTLTGLPCVTGDVVALHGDAAATYAEMARAIDAATRHVHVEFYIQSWDPVTDVFYSALERAVARGVAVRLLVDAIGSFSLYARRSRCQALQELLAAGGELALFHPARLDRFRPLVNLRTHRKLVVCDGRVGFIGGVNITDEENENVCGERAWRDTHLELRGAAVRWLQYVFLQDWAYASGKTPSVLSGDTLFGAPSGLARLAADPSGQPAQIPAQVPVQIVASGPDTDGEAILRAMVDAIGLARERIWLATPYFVPTEETLFALTSAALRGVQVKLMVPACGDSRLTSAAARSYFDELQRAGVLIFEYTAAMFHAKTLLVDDRYGMVGSANFDNRSFRLNFEAAAVVLDEAFNAELAAMFTRDLSLCRRVPARRQLSFSQRLLEATARLFSRVL